MTDRVRPEDVQSWQATVGKGETRTEVLSIEALRRFAAAIGQDLDVERVQPSLAHWAFFLLLPVHFLMGPFHGAIVNWAGHKYGYRNFKAPAECSLNSASSS